MGTIIPRKNAAGKTRYTAQIRITRDGKTVHSESKTRPTRQEANAWMAKREAELALTDAYGVSATTATLEDAIDRYVRAKRDGMGTTKAQVLKSIKTYDIAKMRCQAIKSSDLVSFAEELLSEGQRKPQTVGNYMSHLSAVFTMARPAWGYQLDQIAMKDAMIVLKSMGSVKKSSKRDRRPTLGELDLIMDYFVQRSKRGNASPMHKIVSFAIFSTRRMEEITRITHDDYDKKNARVLVRDMKHPGQKIGNDQWCDIVPEAARIIDSMPAAGDRIFPYNVDAISAAFTRGCRILGIDDLHFHDLRHDGISRLFEMGWTIPHVAAVSGHRSWQSLQRYTHMREAGDKYVGWKWMDIVCAV